MKYTLSFLFLISCCTNFAADTTEQVNLEQKKSSSHRLLKVAIPVLGTVIGAGVLAYVKHAQIPNLSSIKVHTIKTTETYDINPKMNGLDLLQTIQRYERIPVNIVGMEYQAKLMIGFREHFYSLFRTLKMVEQHDNVQSLIKSYRSNNFWLFLRTA
jgi:hypothetical protein